MRKTIVLLLVAMLFLTAPVTAEVMNVASYGSAGNLLYYSLALGQSTPMFAFIAISATNSPVVRFYDEMQLSFGTNDDITMEFDEAVDDQFLITTSKTAASAITDPLFEFLCPASPTSNQEIFGVAKGTQASNTALLTLDEDGDLTVPGVVSGATVVISGLTASKPVFTDASSQLTSSGTLGVDQGGTGVATITDGGVVFGNGTSAVGNTGVLADGSIIIGDGATDPVTLAAFSSSTGTLKVANGGTGLSAGTSGGVLAYTASGTLASSAALAANQLVLGGGAGAAPATLGSLGTTTTLLHGNAGGAPSFSAVSMTADVTGILPIANGGTGVSALTAYNVVLGGTTANLAAPSATIGVPLISAGSGANPAFGALPLATSGTVSGILPIAYGGTGVSDLAGSGPLFLNAGVMTSEANLDVSRGGTGVATLAQYGILVGNAANDVQVVAASANTGAPLLSAGASANPAYGALNLAGGSNIVSGILPVANGGTGVSDLAGDGALYLTGGVMTSEAQLSVSRGGSGAATFTDHGVLVGSAAAAFTALSVGGANEILCGAAGADPGFRALVDADIPAALTLTGSTIENSPIGASTANTGRFTTCTATSKFSGSEIENAGNVTIDAVNAGANSNVYVQNSADTYTASLNVDGDLVVSGHSDSKISIQSAIEAVDVEWTYNGANGAWKITGGSGALAGKVVHIRLQDLVVGEEVTGWRIEGMVGATGGATTEVDACMYKVAAAATDPTASAVGTAMTQIDVNADTKLDNGSTFAAETVAAETEYYIAVTGGVSNSASCDIQVLCAEVDLNRKP